MSEIQEPTKLCKNCSAIADNVFGKDCPFVDLYKSGEFPLSYYRDNHTGYVKNDKGETIAKCPDLWIMRGWCGEYKDKDGNIINIIEYLSKNSLTLKIAKKAELAIKYSYGDDCLTYIAELFINEKDLVVKEDIISTLMAWSDDCPSSLGLQKTYRDITCEICSWNNAFIIVEWLKYSFFYHSESIFGSIETMSDFANTPNDDVFEKFIFNLVLDEKKYKRHKNLPKKARKRLYDNLEMLINARCNHPKKEELVEALQTLLGDMIEDKN